MNIFRSWANHFVGWLEGDDPSIWQSMSPTTGEMAKILERHSLSSQLAYRAFDPEQNIYHNASTVGFVLGCSPLVGATSSIQRTLARLFTSAIPEGGCAQILLYGSPRIALPLEAYCKARANASEIHQVAAQNLALFLNQGAYKPLFSEDSVLVRDFKVYFSLTLDNSYEKEALYQLQESRIQIATSLENANIYNYAVEPPELLGLIRELTEGNISTCPERVPYDPKRSIAEQATSIESHVLLIDCNWAHVLMCDSSVLRYFRKFLVRPKCRTSSVILLSGVAKLDVPFSMY
jgi:TraC protein